MKYIDFLKEKQYLAISLGKEDSAALIYLLYVSELDTTELYMQMENEIPETIINKFDEGFAKYLYNNEPIQYLTNYQTLYGYDFYVDNRVLIPRFETEELVENVLYMYDEYFDGQNVDVCDIGTGSGAIAISLAKEEAKMKVVATDISDEALEVAEINNQKFAANVEFLQGSMVEPLVGRKFDIIVSNPPYIPNEEEVMSIVKDNEPHVALFGGKDGLDFYRIILRDAKLIMKDKVLIAFEHGYNKNQEIEDLALSYFEGAKVIHKKDMQGKDRMTFILVGDFNAK